MNEPIPQSQIYPFHVNERALRRSLGTELREVTIDDYLQFGATPPGGATTVCFQTRFDIPAAELVALVEIIRDRNPGARVVYLDWFAPTDLRLAQVLEPLVDVYVKKHILRDRAAYQRPTLGDTNLSDYYHRHFKINAKEVKFNVNDDFFKKLLVGPSFFTANFMWHRFQGPPPVIGDRPIDVHARLAVTGSPWYQQMREECAEALTRVSDLNVVSGTGIGHDAYLRELRATRICFSPFGYGEVCWRDYEAIMSGAVLLKPDMSHVETAPDIFWPNHTYMPLKWDLSDFEEKVRLLRDAADLRAQLALNAFNVLHDYVSGGGFLHQMSPILE